MFYITARKYGYGRKRKEDDDDDYDSWYSGGGASGFSYGGGGGGYGDDEEEEYQFTGYTGGGQYGKNSSMSIKLKKLHLIGSAVAQW